MLNDKELNRYIKSGKTDVADNGFSERVTRRLPGRSSVLPRIIIIACLSAGLAAMIFTHGITPFFEQFRDFAIAIGNMQMPPVSSIVVYFTSLVIVGSIGFAVYKTE